MPIDVPGPGHDSVRAFFVEGNDVTGLAPDGDGAEIRLAAKDDLAAFLDLAQLEQALIANPQLIGIEFCCI